MSNHNADIKNLFAHLGLNEDDYLELRRQRGGTDAERANPTKADAPTRARSTQGPAPHASTGHGNRFDAQSQPKVYLPGLVPDLGSPEQPPSVKPRFVPVTTEAAKAPATPTLPPLTTARHQSPVADPPTSTPVPPPRARRWPMLDAAGPSSHLVAQVRQARHRNTPTIPAVPATSSPPAPDARAWAGLSDPPRVAVPPSRATAKVNPSAEGLHGVLARIANPEMTTTERHPAPRLHYAPRPLSDRSVNEAPTATRSEWDVVLSRLSRARH